MSISEFAERSGGLIRGDWVARAFSGFALDSREVVSGDLFLAVRGSRADGHDFVDMALQRGAVGALVERAVEGPHLLVPNLVQALARFAASRRAEFSGPVVGVTGSAGKTSTKEFIAAALSPLGTILKTEGNRNTEYTCPLVWANLEPDHQAVVVELSMRGLGQIRHLASFCSPTLSVITNVGYAHLELVGTRSGIAAAKAEILESLGPSGNAVLPAEDEYADFLISKSPAPVSTFGFESGDCRITKYRPLSWTSCYVEGVLGSELWSATLPTVGKHMAVNAACAVLVANRLGIGVEEAAQALSRAVMPPMRMEVREIGGVTFVLDTYNASPSSMVAALETLRQLPCTGRKLAILGEMRELGENSVEGHRQVGKALANNAVDRVVLFGQATTAIQEAAEDSGFRSLKLVGSKSDIARQLGKLQSGDVVLIKGSRALELESVLEDLMAVPD